MPKEVSARRRLELDFPYSFEAKEFCEEKKVTMRKFVYLFLFLCITQLVEGQSCCSGGVPLSNNLGLPSAQAGMLQLGLSYDFNNLNTLRAGWDRLADDSRRRTTQSILLNWGISISEKLAVEGILSYLQQERKITQRVGTDIARASGLGDAVLLLTYTLFSSLDQSSSLRIAGGVKAPLGDFNRTNDLGLILNAELQPGSGAWDVILWSQWTQNFAFRPSLSYHLTMAYSDKGQNNEYLQDQRYQFGNEVQISTGIADRLIWGNQVFDPGLTFRYRRASEDLFNKSELPATGGEWIFMEPSLAYWITPDFSFNFSVSFPVMAYVRDTQFSPTIRTTIGVFHRLALWKSDGLNLPSF